MDFTQFENLREDYKHSFARTNPGMLRHLFGTEDVAPFWIADMDFPVAKPIRDELRRLADRGVFAYEFASGKVHAALVDWYRDRHVLELDKAYFLQVTGVLTGLSVLVRELTAEGEGVLIQSPVYHQFATLIKGAGRKVVKSPLRIVEGAYEMNFEDLDEKFQMEEVRLMLLCNPHNPVGRVWKREELERLVELANRHGVTIVSDEIHSDIVYSGHRFHSIMTVDRERHIALLGSPAKTFGMQSISHGHIYMPGEEMRNRIKKTIGAMYLDHGNALSAYATVAAYRQGGPWLDALLAYLERTIQWMREFLEREMPRLRMFPVEGTYQVWLDFSGLGLDKGEMMEMVVGRAKLGLTPGEWFDRDSALFMRMNIASPLAKVQAALKQLKSAYAEFSA